MSNFLAIATVTATLRQMLLDVITAEDTGQPLAPGAVNATVTVGPPGDQPQGGAGQPQGGAHVNLFLYQVTPNAAGRNNDLPTRDSSGRQVQRPRAALDLYYLLSFYGDENTLEPQRLLGMALRTLHSEPQLSRERINQILQAAQNPANPLHPTVNFLADSDFQMQTELVKFSPVPMNTDELSKLWTIFTGIPYVLSVIYQASVVFIESKDLPAAAAQPVLQRNIYAIPFSQPSIDVVRSEDRISPITVGQRVVIQGTSLGASAVRLRIGDVVFTPSFVSDTQVVGIIPPTVSAGIRGIEVMHINEIGSPPQERIGAISNTAAFALSPVIDGTPTQVGALLQVRTIPATGDLQQCALLLSQPAQSFTVPVLPRGVSGAPSDPSVLTFNIQGIQPGLYVMRIRVDGAQSPLVSTAGAISGPTVTIA